MKRDTRIKKRFRRKEQRERQWKIRIGTRIKKEIKTKRTEIKRIADKKRNKNKKKLRRKKNNR